MLNLIIRKVTEADGPPLQTVARIAWKHTYSHIFTEEFIEKFISQAYNPEFLLRYLQDPGQSLYVVAVDKGNIIGFAQIGPDWDFKGEFRLSRIYLLPEFIGKGIGSRLLKRCESYLRSINHTKYGLYVHKDNEIGKSFYFKHDFARMESRDDDGEWYLTKSI